MKRKISALLAAAMCMSMVTTVSAQDAVMSDDMVPDDTVTGDAVTDDAVTDEAVTDETVTDDAVAEDAVTDDAVTDETVTDDAVTDETVTEDAAQADEDTLYTDYAEIGANSTVTYVDSSKTLHLVGEFTAADGDNSIGKALERAGCSKDDVLKVVAEEGAKLPQDSTDLFGGFLQTTDIDLSKADTSGVTSMRALFNGCSALTSLDISGFDTSNVTNMRNMFGACGSLTSLDLSGLDTSKVTDMGNMFDVCISLKTLELSNWDTSNVRSMTMMFRECHDLETITVTGYWIMSNVGSSYNMFLNCRSLKGMNGTVYDAAHIDGEYARLDGGAYAPGYLSGVPYDTSVTYVDDQNVMHLVGEFTAEDGDNSIGKALERAGCSKDDVLKVVAEEGAKLPENSGDLFLLFTKVTEIDLSKADTSNVKDMSYIFAECNSLKKLDLSGVDTSKITDMSYMFMNCSSLESVDLSGFDTSNVTDMQYMFAGCASFTTLDLSSFDTRKVTEMGGMFTDCAKLKTIEVCDLWSNAATVGLDGMGQGATFDHCHQIVGGKGTGFYDFERSDSAFARVDGGSTAPGYLTAKKYSGKITYVDASNVLHLTGEVDSNSVDDALAFAGKTREDILKVVVDNYAKLPVNCERLFGSLRNATEIDLTGADSSETTAMGYMFGGCVSAKKMILTGLDTSNVAGMKYMFANCESVTDLDLSGFDTSNVDYMPDMFLYCKSLTYLDLRSFDTSNVTGMSSMFYGCPALKAIRVSELWSTEKLRNLRSDGFEMFKGCTSLVGGSGTAYDEDHIHAHYAHIDGGAEDPGYFTDREPVVAVTKVKLSKTTLKMDEGAVSALTATVSPTDATNKDVVWSVTAGSDKVELYLDKACKKKLTEGTAASKIYVKGLADGTATVRVESSSDSTKYAVCKVTVSKKVYSVTVSSDENGTASASAASGTEGTEITLTATPNSGYRLKKWEVSGGITLADPTAAQTTFKIGAANVDIVAIFEKVPVTAPAKPTVVVKTAFGGKTMTFNCADKGAVIYYNIGSSNITTSCKKVANGGTVFFDTPMAKPVYFKAYMNGKWSAVSKNGLNNVQIAKPLCTQSGKKADNNFKVYTQTKNSYIVYTLDGSVPSIEEGTQSLKVKNGRLVWSTSTILNIPKGRTIKAIAVRSGLVTSDVMTYKNS